MAAVTAGDEDATWSFPLGEARALVLVWIALPFAFAAACFSIVSHTQSRPFAFPAWTFLASLILAGRVLIGRAQRRDGRSFWSGGSGTDLEATRAAVKTTGWSPSLVWLLSGAGYALSALGLWYSAQAVMQP